MSTNENNEMKRILLITTSATATATVLFSIRLCDFACNNKHRIVKATACFPVFRQQFVLRKFVSIRTSLSLQLLPFYVSMKFYVPYVLKKTEQ
jgi:hypothetical protein